MVAGGFGSFKSMESDEFVMILHNNATRTRRGPVLRPASPRARERPGAGGSSGGESESFGRVQEALWRLR